ncbi:hypothetical protein KRP22_005310 [Phytophthora ramorum]|uniref:uncharacterized protein n=1 Tax=Phytophthora ramorum TaxID=164328 RepID=UPI00309C0FE9|nr:hypothetical protein KRP23_3202 [Phytophthora ramorum]KAH7508476.1 hypothetical protein KRP22_3559 [Phytophthora ramorum]
MPCSSDAETVLGDEEDSSLSPCVWTAAVHARERHTAEEDAGAAEPCALQASTPASSRGRSALRPSRTELRLSPASQLNVLSQISELADVQAGQSTTAAASRPSRQAQRAHVWSSTSGTAKRKLNTCPKAPPKPNAKKQKKKQPARSQAERLAADMADWETCSEGELFAVEGDADEWVYEDISDSDFEA